MRGDALEMIRTNHNAFVLAYVIAYRARWRDGFNEHGLEQGEALGDHENYGMSEREYRTAKHQLAKWKFATFKATSKGTIGKLVDTRLFSTSAEPSDGQSDNRATIERQSSDNRATDRRRTGDD